MLVLNRQSGFGQPQYDVSRGDEAWIGGVTATYTPPDATSDSSTDESTDVTSTAAPSGSSRATSYATPTDDASGEAPSSGATVPLLVAAAALGVALWVAAS